MLYRVPLASAGFELTTLVVPQYSILSNIKYVFYSNTELQPIRYKTLYHT